MNARHRPDGGVPRRVLFVCTGNICRSPTAERLAAASARKARLADIEFRSAGTHAIVGHPMQPSAARVLDRLGGDSSTFAARQLTKTIAVDADFILTMTRAHRDYVLHLAPQKLHRTYTLREAAQLATQCGARTVADLATTRSQLRADDDTDIPDPIGKDDAFYVAVAVQIAELVPPVLELCRSI